MGLGEFFRGLFGGSAAKAASDSCVACGSSDVDVLAVDAYRCSICGYEGGDGYAAYVEDKKRAQYRTKSTDALLGLVVKELETTRLSLVAALGIAEPGTGWNITVTFSQGSALASADEEERERMRREREAGLMRARAEVVALRPLLDVLGEQGMDVEPHLRRLEAVQAADPCPPETLQAFLQPAGEEFSGAAGV